LSAVRRRRGRRRSGSERGAGLLDRLGLGLQRLAELLGAGARGSDHALELGLRRRQAVHSRKMRSVSTTTITAPGVRCAWATPGSASESAASAVPKASLFIRMRFLH
jgi:hypothetical protein